ncbi:hypothetical protein Goshw_017772 [Gossypium schwendimanii]|uniref:Tryptophan synthase beta chain-like PALP domain-containing protein n=1 Tax=Gossypium schwendimanii TaxID=34291 RepID=A0A7J9MC69_GOSSC|nr:hypothetical protein [Gossypium schwendimanii]
MGYFFEELTTALRDYVGRETPLYFAQWLTYHYKNSKGEGIEIYLKREDPNHGSTYKINNAIAQAMIAKWMGWNSILAATGDVQHGHLRAEVEFIDETFKDGSSEAIRALMGNLETKYYLVGTTVGPHPCPSMVWSGSNALGLFHEFINDEDVRLIGVEAAGLENPGVGPKVRFLKEIGREKFHTTTSEEAIATYRRLCQLEGIFQALEASHALAFLEKLCPTLPNGTKVVVNLSSRRDKDATIVFQYQPDQLID